MRFPKWLMTFSVLGLLAPVARSDQPDLKTLFNQLLPGMSQEQAQQAWQEACWNAAAPGHEAQRSLACKLMAEKLASDMPTPARVWLLKQLERIGRGECVAAIAPFIADREPLVSDAALRALTNNPDRAAGDRLREAFKAATENPRKIAIANALGFRAEPVSVPLLAETTKNPASDPALVSAAAHALGRIEQWEAAQALISAFEHVRGPARLQVGDALARKGQRLAAGNRRSKQYAHRIGNQLLASDGPVRLAGLEILLDCGLADVRRTILEIMARHDDPLADVAVGHVAQKGGTLAVEMGSCMQKLPARRRIALLRALGASRVHAALPAVVEAAGSQDQAVRAAALEALGGIGDRSTVPLLLKAIEQGGDPAKVARHSLEIVFADGVDQALIETLKKTEDKGRRALFIGILDERRAVSAVPALLEEVASDDGNVRRRAIAALGNVASPEDVKGMIKGLLTIKDAGERDEAGRAVAAVCARAADESQQADPVLTAYQNAAPTDQLLLVPVLGRIGGAKALAIVREAVVSSDDARRKSGQQALFNWPDAAAAPDLAKLVESTSDKDLKIRAEQKLARVVVQPGPLSDDERLALLIRGFKASDRNEEKRLILDRAREVPTFATVKFAAEHMAEPRLASQAIATVVDLLHRDEIRKPNQPAADTILDQVIKLSKDKSLVERAKSFKAAK